MCSQDSEKDVLERFTSVTHSYVLGINNKTVP